MSAITLAFHTRLSDFYLDVALSLPSKGIAVLLGESGCGKTTLLRCIAGLQRADGYLNVGDSVWQSKDNIIPTHQREVGYVFQESSLFPHLNVEGNLRYGYRRTKQNKRRVDFDETVSLLGLQHLLSRRIESLSGGQRQRVAIARALLTAPKLLLMDEPLISLDMDSKANILPYLEQLHRQLSIPIIYVTHSPDEATRLGDYLVIMDKGQVIAQGKPNDTLSQSHLPKALRQNACTLIDTVISEIDTQWHLAKADFDGGHLWINQQHFEKGQKIRLRIFAADVSIALQREVSSIQNILAGKIEKICPDTHPALAQVHVRIGQTLVLARLTQKALSELALVTKQAVFVQIKSVAVSK